MEQLAQELQDDIFDLFDLESDYDRASLSALGRTCKRFVFPSQRRLLASISLRSRPEDYHAALRRTKELNELTSPDGGSPHLLTYIKKVRYTMAISEVEEGRNRMKEEALALDQLVPRLRTAHTLVLTGVRADSLGISRFAWLFMNAVQDVQSSFLTVLLSIPNLTALHVKDIVVLPVQTIRWDVLKSLCLDGVEIGRFSRPLFSVDALGTGAAAQPGGCDPSLPVSPLEELRISSDRREAISEFTDWILRECRLKNLRYLGVQQSPIVPLTPLSDDCRSHESLDRLLKECKSNLGELVIDMPSIDPCARRGADTNQASSALGIGPLNLSSHHRLKNFKKRIICVLGGYNHLNETLLTLGQTLRSIPRGGTRNTAEVDEPLHVHLHLVFYHLRIPYRRRKPQIEAFTSGRIAQGLDAIDKALAGTSSKASNVQPESSATSPVASLHVSLFAVPGSDGHADLPTEELVSSFFPLLVAASRFSTENVYDMKLLSGARRPDIVKCDECY